MCSSGVGRHGLRVRRMPLTFAEDDITPRKRPDDNFDGSADCSEGHHHSPGH
jgi:hypothetical protein